MPLSKLEARPCRPRECRPVVTGIIETALHVRDLPRSIEFYQQIFGLEIIERNDRLCALSVARRNVLLLFLEGASASPVDIPGGRIPPHGSGGSIHFAFSVDRSEIAVWEQFLARKGVVIEGRVQWDRGGTSLYFRDPDGHLVELATPGLWSVY